MAKKHVLIDIRPLLTDHISGVTVYLNGLLQNLAKDTTYKYSLYCNSANKKCFPNLEKHFSIYYTRYPNKIFNLLIAKTSTPKIDKLINEKVDIFLAPDLRPTALSKNVKKIQIVHDFSWAKYPQFFSKKTNLWFKLMNPRKEIFESNAIVTPSESIKKECIEYTEGKIPVHSINPFIKTRNRETKGKNQKSKTFFFVGTLEPRKNLEKTLKAFEIVHKKDSETKLMIAGIEDKKVFNSTKQQKKVGNKKQRGVHYLGSISEELKEQYLQKSSCLVYLSHYEGFGLPIAESIMQGTPCLISQDPALKETAGAAGLSVNANNIEDIVEGMEKILYDETTYNKLVNSCYQQAKQWDQKQTLEKWLDLFQDLLQTDSK